MTDTTLFTTAEARAFDYGTTDVLGNNTTYPDADLTAAEARIRAHFERICRVAFFPTTVTDEYHSGDGSQILSLSWPKVTSVTAVSTRSDSTWTALTADELADLHIDPDLDWCLYREGSCWPTGTRNIKVTYVHGFSSVPTPIKRAALICACAELIPSEISSRATSYSDGTMSFQLTYAGSAPHWTGIPEVDAVLELYNHSLPGIA
jgi:hypothetical protein